MVKLQESLIEPVQERRKYNYKHSIYNQKELFARKIEDLLIRRGILYFIFGFLLGRAFILSSLSPFSLPFFAVIFLVRRKAAPAVFVGVVGGALSISLVHAGYTFLIVSLFLIMIRTVRRFVHSEIKAVPYYVLFTTLIGRGIWQFAVSLDLSIYQLLMIGVEASLAFILTLIFLQSIPLITGAGKRQALKTEEIVCLIILVASILTGTMNWEIENIAIVDVLARFVVLLFAFTAGATIGTTVGVVIGLILGLADVESFAQLSLLAFSGLIGGLLKEGKKIGVSIGLLISTLLIGMYNFGTSSLLLTLYTSLFATLLFFITPKRITDGIAKQIPGTNEYVSEQQAYMRTVRDITAKKVDQFASLFHTLSRSFRKEELDNELNDRVQTDLFLSGVTENTCQTCFKRGDCWLVQFSKTYDGMKQIMTELEENNGQISRETKREWAKHCSKSERVIQAIKEELPYYQANRKLNQQLVEARKLVAEQLHGVSVVMDNFSKEIKKEQRNHEKQEEQIVETLQSFGVEIDDIEIYSLEKGNVDIDITIPYCDGYGLCEKIIAPILSDILGENIIVHNENCGAYPNEYCHATFRSNKRFKIETGLAYAAKDGGFLSGDSYTMLDIGFGKYALAISDGMGNGEKAFSESNDTIQLLKRMLKSGIDEELAIKSINSILALRTTDEIYSTLDLAIIDLRDAKAKFLKVGSIPSFIKRGDRIMKIQANNLPIGILEEVEVDVVSTQFKAGDLLVMMSDGVFEGHQMIGNVELWLKRKIRELQTDEPQEVADLIMEEVIRARDGEIFDDMTVMVAKIMHNNPKWASIPTSPLKKWA